MTSRKVRRAVLDSFPELFALGEYYLFRVYSHVLTGFYCEFKTNSVNFWKVAYPLFDASETLNLTYSECKHNCRFLYTELSRARVPTEFCKMISLNRNEVQEWGRLESFVNYLEFNGELLRNPNIRRTYAKSLIFLSKRNEALQQFDICIQAVPNSVDPEFNHDCQKYIELLKFDTFDPVLILSEEEDKKIQALGLSGKHKQ